MKQIDIESTAISNPNHPRKGAKTKSHPIPEKYLDQIKSSLADNPRNLALFVLGIRLGLRLNELLSVTFEQVGHLGVGDSFEVYVSKQDITRILTLDTECVSAIQTLRAHSPTKIGPLFMGKRGVLTVSTASSYVKEWCLNVPALRKQAKKKKLANFSGHSLRRTFVSTKFAAGVPMSHLSKLMGHSTEAQTFAYASLQPEEEKNIYLIDDKDYQSKRK